MASFQDRVVGALKAQASTFAEVLQDPGAIGQAAIVVAAGAVSRAVGDFFRLGMIGGPISLILAPIIALIGWVVGCAVLWVIGTKVITGTRTTVDLPQTMRTMGFAYAPLLGGIIAVIPFLGPLLALVLGLYTFYVALVAAKELFGYPDFLKAFLALLIAFVVVFVTMALLALLGLGAGLAGGFLSR